MKHAVFLSARSTISAISDGDYSTTPPLTAAHDDLFYREDSWESSNAEASRIVFLFYSANRFLYFIYLSRNHVAHALSFYRKQAVTEKLILKLSNLFFSSQAKHTRLVENGCLTTLLALNFLLPYNRLKSHCRHTHIPHRYIVYIRADNRDNSTSREATSNGREIPQNRIRHALDRSALVFNIETGFN